MATLFFAVMDYDGDHPESPANDHFVLSKGHAAPVLYAALAEAGIVPVDELTKLRRIDSNLEGHPTPRAPFVRAATGSLGQGLSIGAGLALGAKRLDRTSERTYVLMGDGESAEGSVWEAAALASHYGLDNLCAVIDINRLGQSEPTMLDHRIETYANRWRAFGWNALTVDGHDIEALLGRFAQAHDTHEVPSIILAQTLKAKGIPDMEDKLGYHGKPLPKPDADEVIKHLESERRASLGASPAAKASERRPHPRPAPQTAPLPAPPYSPGDDPIATRGAFGEALAAAGKANPDVVVLDGDVKNSTYTELFEKDHPERFFQMFIAEQNMVGTAIGLAARGKIPVAASFACFLSRAYDFARMAAIGNSNIKLMGSHAGVSIGEDGPSQMGLEDLALFGAQPNFTVFCPSDGTSVWRALELALKIDGPVYIRTTRPKTPVLYESQENFEVGRCKVLRQSEKDELMIVACGVTVFEALQASDELATDGIAVSVIDLFCMQPIDHDALRATAAASNNRVIVVEDHYSHGGIGDAVASALAQQRSQIKKLAVREIPRSGAPDELLDRHGISSKQVVAAVREVLK